MPRGCLAGPEQSSESASGVEKKYHHTWVGDLISVQALLAASQASGSEMRCRGKEYHFIQKAS